MEILKWRKGYATGVEQMDDQHKRLIELVNQMYRVIRDKEGTEALDGVLQKMSDYAERHLRDEEDLLHEYSYPGLESHKKAHSEYYAKMDELLAEMNVDKQKAAQKIYVFLRKWWVEHIVGEDREYGPFLRKKKDV